MKTSEYIKKAFKRKNSFGVRGKIIRNFYQLIADKKNKLKILELFKIEGRGATIEIKGEPIFSFFITLDYLQSSFNNCQLS